MHVQKLIDEFTAITKNIINANLTGIYLHGSLAMNCFNPKKSDIDIILVIEHSMTDSQKMGLMNQIVKLNERAPAKGLEISVVKREYCKPFVYPTPFELHFSPMHLNWFEENPQNYVDEMNGEDKDLAAHFTIINRYGIVLYGKPIVEVFGEVSRKDYFESIWFDVEGAREDSKNDPMYSILNLCRVLAFAKEDLCLSKQQGGEWGTVHLPKRFHPLIAQALDCYQSDRHMQADVEFVSQFVEEMLDAIVFENHTLNE